jgi:hypothetical protein
MLVPHTFPRSGIEPNQKAQSRIWMRQVALLCQGTAADGAKLTRAMFERYLEDDRKKKDHIDN